MMQKRRLGRTEHHSTIVTFGGAALSRVSQEEAFAALDMMQAAGVNHIDIAPTYGFAEKLTGPWLETRRDQFFVGCKTTDRTREGAWKELQTSLRLLHIDRVDLHQFHAVTTFEQLEQALAPGGAIEAFYEAREKGLTRWLGITGHGLDSPAIQIKALEQVNLDTVMFPLNPVLYANEKYRTDAERLLQICAERDIGVQIIKSIAKGPWRTEDHTYATWYEPFDQQVAIQQGVNFALSQHPVASLPAAGDVRLLPMVLQAAEAFTPLNGDEQAALIGQAHVLEPLFV